MTLMMTKAGMYNEFAYAHIVYTLDVDYARSITRTTMDEWTAEEDQIATTTFETYVHVHTPTPVFSMCSYFYC